MHSGNPELIALAFELQSDKGTPQSPEETYTKCCTIRIQPWAVPVRAMPPLVLEPGYI